MHSKNESIIKYKILYSFVILLIYTVGKSLPIYMVDLVAYVDKSIGTDELLLQTISGDIYQCSIFALGISPYMISTIIVQIVTLFMNADKRSKVSPTKMTKISLVITLVIAMLQAAMRVNEIQFSVTGNMLYVAKMVALVEMVTGAVVIFWLASRCKRFGLGGQSVLILANVIDSVRTMLSGYDMDVLAVPLVISLFVMIVTVIMENAEMRIPVQRISIHNIYADKNYMAIKMNPIGVMPAMFSTAVFMLPQMIMAFLTWIFPDNNRLAWCEENMSLTRPLGIATYIVILYILSMVFARVFINPSDITVQYLKSGYSIVNLHAGQETKKYLSRSINRISFVSATLMSVCLVLPIILNVYGYVESQLTVLPSMVMMLTGLWCNIYREYKAMRNLEAYKPFI